MRQLRLNSVLAILFVVVLVLGTAHAGPSLVLTALSASPDRVSGGDVAWRIDVPAGVPLADVTVTLNGVDVTGAFRAADAGHGLVGLVTGLENGNNVLRASTSRANPSSQGRLDLRNFPSYGP